MRHALDKQRLASLCRAHHVQRLALFGSWARDGACPDSDVDLLVAYASGCKTTLWDHWALEEALSPVFDGKPIDLVSEDALSPHIKNEVLASRVLLYEERADLS